MSGVELSERLIAERPRTAVVLMSGYTDTVALERLRDAPVSFLEKRVHADGAAPGRPRGTPPLRGARGRRRLRYAFVGWRRARASIAG